MTSVPAQLALCFPRPPGFASADLLPNAAQEEARAWLSRAEAWPLQRLALWGEAGSGKSHLAHEWAARAGGVVVPAASPLAWPSRAVVVDAIDQVPDEPALLHLLNATAEAGYKLLLVSREAPGRLPVRLPDLASRLRATTAVRIGPADDDFLALLLTRLLAEYQLRLSGELQSWLLSRLARSPGAVRDAVLALDAAALAGGRTLTQRRIGTALHLHDSPETPARTASPSPGGSS